jgi:hypothetical protein
LSRHLIPTVGFFGFLTGDATIALNGERVALAHVSWSLSFAYAVTLAQHFDDYGFDTPPARCPHLRQQNSCLWIAPKPALEKEVLNHVCDCEQCRQNGKVEGNAAQSPKSEVHISEANRLSVSIILNVGSRSLAEKVISELI